jgi:NMD protein affecting ribosome stability and mRNA decay
MARTQRSPARTSARLLEPAEQGTEQARPPARRMITVCAGCGMIRRPEADPWARASWRRPRQPLPQRRGRLTHGLCPDCFVRLYPTLQRPGAGQ